MDYFHTHHEPTGVCDGRTRVLSVRYTNNVRQFYASESQIDQNAVIVTFVTEL